MVQSKWFRTDVGRSVCMKTQKKFGVLIAALCLLLCGCGADGGQVNVETSEGAAQEGYYRISETVLPDPDLALAGELAQDGWVREPDQDFIEGKVYRIAQVWGTLNGIEQTTGYYLQILDSPYQEWKTLLVSSATWDESLEGIRRVSISAMGDRDGCRKRGVLYCPKDR